MQVSDTNDGNDTTFLKLLAYMYIIRYTGTRKSYRFTRIPVIPVIPVTHTDTDDTDKIIKGYAYLYLII